MHKFGAALKPVPPGTSESGLSKWQILGLLGLGVSVSVVCLGAVWYVRKKRSASSSVPPSGGDSPRNHVENQGKSDDVQPKNSSDESNAGATSGSSGDDVQRALEIKAKGNELFKQKKYEEAFALYEDALAVCPADRRDDLAAIHQNMAACLENKVSGIEGKDEKAVVWKDIIARCTQAIELKPKYIKALVRRFRAFDALSRTRDALLDVVRVLVIDESQNEQFQGIMPRLLKEIGRQLAEDNYQKLKPLEPPSQLIRTYFNTFHWKDDLSMSRLKSLWSTVTTTAAADLQDDDDDGFNTEPFVKAAAMFRDNSFTGIINVLSEAIESGNDVFKPHAYLLRGSLCCLWRRDQEALQDLQKVLEWERLPAEVYADAHIKKAAIFAGLCQLDKCHDEFSKAVDAKPDHADIYIQRARVYLESEDVSILMKAPEDLEVALKLAPSAPHTLYCLGAVFHRGGLLSGSMHLLQSAKSKFEEAHSKFPDCVEGLILYSLYLQDAQEIEKCEQLLERAIELEPDNASSRFSLSLLYLLVQQDIDKAIRSLESAIAMDSSCIQAYEALASLEMQRGNTDRAHQLYQQAIDNSRSVIELQQAYIAYEVFSTQNQVCEEYNINPLDLMTSRIAAANKNLQQQSTS